MQTAGLREDEIADVLDRLVAKSLIVFDDTISRYRCLETVRQYAREQHVASLDTGAQDPRRKHAKFFKEQLTNLEQPDSTSSLALLDKDYENIRQAMDWWSMQQSDEALEMASALHTYWYARGLLREGTQRTESILQEHAHNKNTAYGHALFCYGDMITHLGHIDEGKATFEEVLSIAKQTSDRRLQAFALSGLAGIHQDHVIDYHLSRDYRMQVLALADTMPDPDMFAARNYYNLGDVTMKHHPDLNSERRREVLLEAKSFFENALQLSSKQPDSRLTYFLYAGLGGVALHLGDLSSAKKQAADGARYCIKSGYKIGEAANFGLLAFCAEEVGSFDVAAILLGGCFRITEETGFMPGAKEVGQALQLMELCRQKLGDEEYGRCVNGGRSMSSTELLEVAERGIHV